MNMEKDFYVVTPERKQNNSRQRSLLKLVGLENRLVVENASMPEKSDYAVDFDKVRPLLEKAREASKKYLKEAIDGK